MGKEITRIARPVLKEAGFAKFTARKAWRYSDQTIDLVDFRSFTSYVATGVGCTTFSFAVTIGVFYRCLDPDFETPQDYNLTFRGDLGKALQQPWFEPQGPMMAAVGDRPDVWYVRPDGSNLTDCVEDATHQLMVGGLPLLDQLGTPDHAYRMLLTETSRSTGFGTPGLSMPGRPDSPRWRDVTIAIGHLVVDDPRDDMRSAPVLTRP